MRVVLQTRKMVQWQSLAGDRVGVAARHDMQRLELVRRPAPRASAMEEFTLPSRKSDLVALDQLARLLHRVPVISVVEILDQQLDLPAEDAALGVDLLDRQLAADTSFLPSAA